MGNTQRLYRKSRAFRSEGIQIHIPRFIRINEEDKELFIGEKPFTYHSDVVDPVINFFVYFVDGAGNINPVTDFSEEKLLLQVGYDHIHDNRELIVYDMQGKSEQRFRLSRQELQNVPGYFYGYPGSVIVELKGIPPDPNVGWGS